MKKQIFTHIGYWAIMLVLLLVGTAWALNIDTDSNNSVDASYGGTNRTAVCSSGELLISDGTDYDCLGSTPAGDLGGTWSNPSVDNDSHTHIPSNITSITEGYIIVGNASNVGAATEQLPNLAISGAQTSDDTWSGIAISGVNAGETITQWQPVHLASDGKWDESDANVAGKFPAMGLAVEAGTDTNEMLVCTRCTVRNDNWNWATVGGWIYLSEDPTGTDTGVTQTAPSDSGDCIQIIGFAISDDEAYFDFSRPYQEVQ